MNGDALLNLNYGLYVLTSKIGEKDNGCIVNTVMQAALKPESLCVCVNKANYTHDMMVKSKIFTVSVLDTKTDFELIKRFGFCSGRENGKFENFGDCKRVSNGTLCVTKNTNAYISANADKIIDLGSHSMFLGNITDAEILDDVPSLTYEHYLKHIKPMPETKPQKSGKIVWRCKICGFEYEGENLPSDYICPLCKHPAEDFEKIIL